MPVEFYYFNLSLPSRAAWMVLEALGLKYEKKVINIMVGEHKHDSYKDINPRQMVPALKDGDFCVAESRAIATYVVNQYGAQQRKQSLYPSDPKKRATVDQHLYISEDIEEKVGSYVNFPGVMYLGEDAKEENLCKAKAAVQAVEDTLLKSTFTAGEDFTIADIFYYMAVGFLDFVDFDFSEYKKVAEWRAKIAAKPWHQEVWADNQVKLKEVYVSREKK